MGRRNRPCCGSQGLAAAAALQATAFFLLAGVAVSASFISDHALGSGGWTGRSLLQAKQNQRTKKTQLEFAGGAPMGRRNRPCCGSQGLAASAALQAIAFFLLAGVAVSASFISDHALGSGGWTGRSLLQAKQNCPVAFEFMNYTVITRQCKGPKYTADSCCGAFKEFACPYAEELNNLSSDCSSTMFSYINLYGKYPPGLFASLCRDSKRGLECTEQQKQAVSVPTSAAAASRVLPLVVMLWFFTFLFI